MITSHKNFVSTEALAKVSSPSAKVSFPNGFIGNPGFKVIENQWIPAKKLCGNDNKKSFARASIFLIFLLSLFIFNAGCGGGGGSDVSLPPITGDTPTGDPSDTTPPQVTSTYPSNGATGFPLNSAISATFSEAMNTSTINNTTFTLSGITGTVSYSGTTAYFTPSSNLSYSTTYTATITTGVKDLAGNQMVSSSSYSWSFETGTTSDTIAPTDPTGLTATTISSSQINLSWTASTDSGGSGLAGYKIERCSGAGCTNFAQIATTTSNTYSDTGLTANTSYSYQVRAYDNANNNSSYSNTASVTTLDTTTPDTTAPTNTTTANFINSGATYTTSTSVTLSISATDGVGVTGYYASESSTTPSASATGWTAITSTTSYSTSVSFTLSSGDGTKTVYVWFKDGAGNVSTSVSDSITLDTTPPTVLSSSISPSNGAINVVVNTLITATFSETMDGTTFTPTTFTLTSGAEAVSGTFSYAGDTATFTPTSSLSYSTTYIATITTGVKDLAGNQMASSYSWSFVTQPVTHYVSPTGSDTTGNGSNTSPWQTITFAIGKMVGGDTLILKDGVYTGLNNMIGDYASPQTYPPSGLGPTAYTTIKAENVGGAIIDAEYTTYAFSNNNVSSIDYVIIQGIHFRHGQCGLFNIMGNYNKVLQSGFEDGQAPTSSGECPIAFVAGGSSYSLVEDSWVWGKGRYGFYTSSTGGGTNHIIFRRVVVRLDDTPTGNITAGLRFYNGQNNVMQNSIVIDSLVSSGSNEPAAITSGGGSSTYEPDHLYEGMMVINNPDRRGYIPEDGATTNTFTNSVLWGNQDGAFAISTFSSPFTLNLSNLTIGENIVYAVRDNTAYSGLTTNLSNSLIQVPNGGTAFNDPDSISNTDVYIPGTGTLGSNPGGYTSITGTTYTAGLKYLPRIESSSAIANAGIGPSILYQIGVSGSIYGDSGWNTVTTTPLWPWPDEGVWTPKLGSYTVSGPGGNRGFAATGQTLTNYVWGYLGNTVPPMNVTAVVGSGSVTLNWDPPVSLSTITGFKVYENTGGTPTLMATVTNNATFTATISGLTNGTAYSFVVTALDQAKGESGYSYNVTATPGSGPSPP